MVRQSLCESTRQLAGKMATRDNQAAVVGGRRHGVE